MIEGIKKMSMVFNVLIISTAHARLGTSGQATGLWLEEFTTPYYRFTQAGSHVTVASLPGGRIPIEPGSLGPQGSNPASVEKFLRDESARHLLENSKPLASLSTEGWDIVYIPGGHGAMWDLASSRELAEFLSSVWANKAVIGSVCHGPAALVNVREQNGKPLVSGRRLNCFSQSEEEAVNLTDTVPFPLEGRLRELGALYEKGPNFTAYAVQDERLITGQNPMSSEMVAQLILKAADELRGK